MVDKGKGSSMWEKIWNAIKYPVLFLLLAAAAFFAWRHYPFLVSVTYGDLEAYDGLANGGQFGDSFGGLTALFTALAFAGVVVSMMMQREELSLQRKELKDTREVLEQQREEMELTRQLQAQPVVDPHVEMHLFAPKLWRTSEELTSHQYQGRVSVGLRNPSPYPAFEVTVLCHMVQEPGSPRKKSFCIRNESHPVLYAENLPASFPHINSSLDFHGEYAFVLKGSGDPPHASASLKVEVFYKNALGAVFLVTRRYIVVGPSKEDVAFYEEISRQFTEDNHPRIQKLKLMSRSRETGGFEEEFLNLKKEFDRRVAEDRPYRQIELDEIPSSFSLRHIGQEEFSSRFGGPRVEFHGTNMPELYRFPDGTSV